VINLRFRIGGKLGLSAGVGVLLVAAWCPVSSSPRWRDLLAAVRGDE
jgi:hypothetical protein